jgi:chromosome partitioning protein
MVISCINPKGGVGKSTLAGNLIGWLHRSHASVALVDCDHQRSSSNWISQALSDLPIVRLDNADAVLEELPRLAYQFDFVIADGPGSNTEVNRAIMLWTDLAVVPCKASMFEAAALQSHISVIRQAQRIRNGPPDVVAVLSMVGQRFRLTHDMRQAAEGIGIRVAESHLSLRQAFADAPGQATFVWEMGQAAKRAELELMSVMDEIFSSDIMLKDFRNPDLSPNQPNLME